MAIYGMKDRKLVFTDEEIAALFGHEAAEDEKPDRLREYYFKNEIYEQIKADLPLRIIVGHKGIGKSALFKVAQQEFEEEGILTITLTPDDIIDIDDNVVDMLKLIRIWKNGLQDIIVEKSIKKFGDEYAPMKGLTGPILNIIQKVIESKSGFSIAKEKEALVTSFNRHKKVVIFIDDLDRGWEGKKNDIRRISAMLNAVRDLSRDNPGICFKISLRTDVYFLYRTSDESTDKVEGNVVWLSWTNFSILALLAKRIVTYFGGNVDEKKLLHQSQPELEVILSYVFEDRFEGQGKWSRIPTYRLLTSLIRKRPRDLVKLCALAAKVARKNQKAKIGTKEFNEVFELYSQGRLQDEIIEYRSELPEIERLLTGMKPSSEEKRSGLGYCYDTDKLFSKVESITQRGKFVFSNGKVATTKELCGFMYKTNFLTARKDSNDGKIIRKYFEENRFLSNNFGDYGFRWEIHPAYRWALQPNDINSIFKSLIQYDDSDG